MKTTWDYIPDDQTASAILGTIAANKKTYDYFSQNKSIISEAREKLNEPQTSFYRTVGNMKKLRILKEVAKVYQSDRLIPLYTSPFENVLFETKRKSGQMKIKLSKYGKKDPEIIVSSSWADSVIGKLEEKYEIMKDHVNHGGMDFHVLKTDNFDSREWK